MIALQEIARNKCSYFRLEVVTIREYKNWVLMHAHIQFWKQCRLERLCIWYICSRM